MVATILVTTKLNHCTHEAHAAHPWGMEGVQQMERRVGVTALGRGAIPFHLQRNTLLRCPQKEDSAGLGVRTCDGSGRRVGG